MNVRFYSSYNISNYFEIIFWRENVRVTLKESFHNIAQKSINHWWFIDFNALRYFTLRHDVI